MSNTLCTDNDLVKDEVKTVMMSSGGQLLWKRCLNRLSICGYHMENYPSDLKFPYEYPHRPTTHGLDAIPSLHQEILFKACYLPDGERLCFVKNKSPEGQSSASVTTTPVKSVSDIANGKLPVLINTDKREYFWNSATKTVESREDTKRVEITLEPQKKYALHNCMYCVSCFRGSMSLTNLFIQFYPNSQ
jgi:hypothetical protein